MENPFKKAVENQEIVNEEMNIEEKNANDNIEDNTTEQQEFDTTEAESNESGNNELQEKYDTLNNQYIRLAADFDNYRKRQEQEKEALLKYGAENTLKKMIEVLDNFDRGIKAIETVEDCQKVKECSKSKKIKVAWKDEISTLFNVSLKIVSKNSVGYASKLFSFFANERINIEKISAKEINDGVECEINVMVAVKSKEELLVIINKLQTIKEVKTVSRNLD